MRCWFVLFGFIFQGALMGLPFAIVQPDSSGRPESDAWIPMRANIQRHLGKPYGWGATGLKTYDCSGFVWRVLLDEGVLIKRTTARKLFLCLRTVNKDDQWKAGNIVFFNNLKHCGISDGSTSFFHADCTRGTTCSSFDPYWRTKVCGFRRNPALNGSKP